MSCAEVRYADPGMPMRDILEIRAISSRCRMFPGVDVVDSEARGMIAGTLTACADGRGGWTFYDKSHKGSRMVAPEKAVELWMRRLEDDVPKELADLMQVLTVVKIAER